MTCQAHWGDLIGQELFYLCLQPMYKIAYRGLLLGAEGQFIR
jgi:hypothetical protein